MCSPCSIMCMIVYINHSFSFCLPVKILVKCSQTLHLLVSFLHFSYNSNSFSPTHLFHNNRKQTSDADVDFVLTTQPSLLPVAQDIPWTKASSLLDVPSLLLLNRHLPHQLRLQWRFLYSSLIHGASFATFLSHIKDKGPIILVVKDSNGNVFGSFVSESLELGPAFTGMY